MNVLLIVSTVLLGLILAFLVLFWLKVAQIIAIFSLFFTSEDENTPSSFAKLMQDLAKMIGQSAAMEVKTTLMGKASGEARLEQAIQADIANDTIQAQSPGIAALLDAYPSLKKRALKNPGLVQFLLSRLGNTSVEMSGNSGKSDFSARLNKYR